MATTGMRFVKRVTNLTYNFRTMLYFFYVLKICNREVYVLGDTYDYKCN